MKNEVSPLSDAHPGWSHQAHSRMTFSEIHEAGARAFGLKWLGSNRVAVEAFQACGVNPATNKKLAKALSLAIYKVLDGAVGPYAQPVSAETNEPSGTRGNA